MALPGKCPIEISSGEYNKHVIEIEELKNWLKLREYAQELHYSDLEGWVPPQLDFDDVRAMDDKLFKLFLEKEAPVSSEEEARRLWFYIDRD